MRDFNTQRKKRKLRRFVLTKGRIKEQMEVLKKEVAIRFSRRHSELAERRS